jgi:hypothetical protein
MPKDCTQSQHSNDMQNMPLILNRIGDISKTREKTAKFSGAILLFCVLNIFPMVNFRKLRVNFTA